MLTPAELDEISLDVIGLGPGALRDAVVAAVRADLLCHHYREPHGPALIERVTGCIDPWGVPVGSAVVAVELLRTDPFDPRTDILRHTVDILPRPASAGQHIRT